MAKVEKTIILKSYLIVAYGVLVKGGRWALTKYDNPNNLKVVPEAYQGKVAEWLAEKGAA